jgi:hypothetical protein
MATNTFQYPTIVSRTLDPDGRSLRTVVGLHDHQLSDADVNLIQDLQDYKRHQALENKSATSGCLSYAPMVFSPFVPNTFTIPAFDVLFNGEVVSIRGFNSPDLTQNRITLSSAQQPVFWTSTASGEDARIYVIFLELWYQALDPTTGSGYYKDPVTQLRYFYPYGCVSPDPSNAEIMPDDSVDIFATTTSGTGLLTTERAQIQWRFNIQRVALTYDFTKYQYGLDPGALSTEIVYGQSLSIAPIVDSTYKFANMGAINGDTGLWQAGDGNVNNSLGTMDGYTYAMPMAVMFQRNYGPFGLTNNIFGCGDPATQNSGLLQYGISGRFDQKLADQIFSDDVVDLRQTVTLDAWDLDKLMRESFVDVITGHNRYAIGRGDGSGLKTEALGSTLDYYVSRAPSSIPNTNTLQTTWDGFSNGFSSDLRVFYVTKKITTGINNPPTTYGKTNGTPNAAWATGDAFSITIPTSSPATFASIAVQSFNSSGTPINLLPGQITISGLGTKSVIVTFNPNLFGTPFDPGNNNLYCTLGVQYPANSGVDLKRTPIAIDGGTLLDVVSSKNLPVYGISEYQIQTSPLAVQAHGVTTYNPEYSNIIFGTRIQILVPASTGVVVGSTTAFVVSRLNLNGKVGGLYPIGVTDLTTGLPYTVNAISMKSTNCVVTIGQVVVSTTTLVMTFLAQDTAQLVYNAPVKGVTEVEETVLFGNYVGDSSLPMDSRVSVAVPPQYNSTLNLTTIVLAANNCIIKGISGDDTSSRFIWVLDQQTGNLNKLSCSTVNFNNGLVTVTVLNDVLGLTGTLAHNPFLFCGSILPAFDPNTSFTVVERYIPYQGEGVLNRNYEVTHNDDNALVTTNGSGNAPIVGLEDIYPYNREIPISTSLPALVSWSDATLTNTPLASLFDSNYVAMRQNNVEHTFEVPLHTNDFIPPMNKDFRKEIQFITPTGGGRGFAQAVPHVGFAITAPVARTVLGQNLQSTTAPIVLYVDNTVKGNDSNDGLSPDTPKATITAALSVLPPVLRHPCSIQLVQTNVPYSITALKDTLQEIALGDGDIRSAVYYALGNISYTIQEGGRLVITAAAGATSPIVIDATGFTGFGNGPTSAFFVDNSRVIFNMLAFTGFTDAAIYGIDADVDFVDCTFAGNLQAGAFSQACGVILDGCTIVLPDGGVGMVASASEITASATAMSVALSANPGAFFIGERASTINLQKHGTTPSEESNILNSTLIAQAEITSSIVVTSDFQTNGNAVLSANSLLAQTITANPFKGGVTTDSSSNIVTLLS